MSTSTVSGLSRLRFQAPKATFELAVPADVPLADLLPAILSYAGPDIEEEGVEHGGWILQRLGGDPLDEERSADSLNLHDGETLYVRHRNEAMPPVHFDDMIDGVVTGMSERGGNWRPELTHHLALGLTLALLAGGLGLLALPGPAHVRDLVAALTGAMLLFGALSAARAVGDAGAGSALGVAAVPYLGLAGAMLPVPGGNLAADRLLAGGSAAAGAAVLALAVVGCSAPLFLGLVLFAMLGVVGGVLGLVGVPVDNAAALVAVIAIICGAFAPALSFRLSGLKLPALPRNAEELQEGIEPVPAKNVLARTAIADNYLTGFYLVVGAACAACMAVTVWTGSSWATTAFTAVLAALLLLHGRAIGGIWQRLAVLVPGACGVALLGARLARHTTEGGRLMEIGVILAVATGLAIAAWTLPGRRLLPYWGRVGDMLHTLTAVSLVPLALEVLGVFHMLRGLGG